MHFENKLMILKNIIYISTRYQAATISLIILTLLYVTGFSHILPYMNPLLLLFFLLDRESVDGEECKKKHGEAWDRYCHRVKYRLIPYVY
jgi:protein-S-isoprenylcysteine O-methyltransferase Ste14